MEDNHLPVAVVVAFFICWAPFHAQRLVAIYGTNEHHLPKSRLLLQAYTILTYISGVFYYFSTTINPILYHIMCNKFRDAFKVGDFIIPDFTPHIIVSVYFFTN